MMINGPHFPPGIEMIHSFFTREHSLVSGVICGHSLSWTQKTQLHLCMQADKKPQQVEWGDLVHQLFNICQPSCNYQ